jgi:hypothetical protein
MPRQTAWPRALSISRWHGWPPPTSKKRGLTADFLWAEPLYAVLPGAGSANPVAASSVTVLVDADASTWSSWNRFPGEFAVDTGARVAKIDDGGIAGEAF